MATKIIIKKSSTAGVTPLVGDLDQGELAVNIADRRLYTKDNNNVIQHLGGAYVGTVAPTGPVEGDLWYETASDELRAYNGSTWTEVGGAAGSNTLLGLTDTTITSITTGEILKWDGAAFINSTLVESGIATVADIPVNNNELFNGAGYITDYTVTEGDVTAHQAALSITESQISELQAYLAVESDTLATVTFRGATTATAVTFTNATSSTTVGDGALVVTGGVGIGENLNVGGNAIITGNLTVNGTTTSVNSTQVDIGDSIILLNSGETGTPSLSSGFEVERGTSANVSFVWNETTDAWDMSDETLQNVVLDGGSY